ncbi:MAG: hypothetical protein Q9209_006219 [Squamulea sp. 1 TL-2023]
MPEHRVNQEPERKSSMAAKDKAKLHVRACESCRTRKIKCLPQGTSEDARCQRCAKSGRECIYSSPEKRKRRKRTDARVADLEQMVQVLAARLEQEQRARLQQEEREHQPRSQDKAKTDQSTPQSSTILSPPPSPNEYPHPEACKDTGNLLSAYADRHQLQSPMDTIKPSLATKLSTRKPIYDTFQTATQSPLPSTISLSPRPFIQEPLPSPLSQDRIPDVIDQPYATWPSMRPFLDPQPHHQSTITEDVYSPCPSHSSTLSHSDICSSEISQDTILDMPAHDSDNITFELPTSAANYNSMDPAISAQLNMPCQDQGIWWPQSNIMCNNFPSETAPIGDWTPREDVFSWQPTRWV